MMLLGLAFPIALFQAIPQSQVDLVAAQCGVTAFLVRQFGGSYLQGWVCFSALVIGATGIGLWRMRPWARRAMIVISCFAVLTAIEELTEFFCTHGCRQAEFSSELICGIFLWYFLRRKIKRAFESETINQASAQ